MTGLPIIDQSLLPADVRQGTSADRKAYGAAMGFERALLGELTKVMAETAKPSDDDDSSQDAAAQAYQSQMPDQLADAIEQGGGIGLAQTLYESMKAGQ
jgi:Rod binding domain-containing protein